ncbi:FimB/Mfa2 family fimbrial subunit [Phocaeicola plebeius]|uniref:FimB/Mfa2 family fimbrial subunit n=1 Tax=Phocaeicola plebeius TaxID=310297 RepID=UPI0026EFC8AA|nr:FimB/Mfa2 family fimbrial subunit [Phocaeicola plebeius]
MRKIRFYMIGWLEVIMFLGLTSCIRDEIQSCPPLKVMIAIEDKNYANIDFVERETGLDHRIDENQPFRSYIQKLFYALYDLDTGEVVTVRHLHDVQGDAEMATVYLPEDLPFGHYGLVVWGNIQREDGILSDGSFGTYNLHLGHVEGYDVYMSADELLYDELNYDYVVKLKRVKGKLLIQAVNFPSEIGWSKKEVSGVTGNVDYEFHYSEPETVVTYTEWTSRTSEFVSSTFLSPSATSAGSTVDADLYDSSEMEVPVIQLQTVQADINRNEITVLRYVYDQDTGSASVYILMDDGWDAVHNLEK